MGIARNARARARLRRGSSIDPLEELEEQFSGPQAGSTWPPAIAEGGGSGRSSMLVPYNGSAIADRALEVAAGLGQPSALIWVLYVRPWDVARAGLRFCLETTEEARRCAHQAVVELRRRGIPASGVVRDARRERVGQVIAGEAERLDVGCIVLGTHAHGAWTSALLGSVSRRVARRATRPVLLVRAPRGRRATG
jgi:nucleotide-binding universal stress UspA family protein